MPNRFTQIAEEAAELTRKELDGELAKITSLSEEKLARLLPNKSDKEKFAELMAIVNSSTNRNNKVAQLRNNIDRLGVVVVKLLELV